VRNRRIHVGLIGIVVLLALSAIGAGWLPGQTAGAATPSLSATFAKTSDWGTGYVANYTVANHGAPIQAWTLRFTLPSGAAITSAWSGNLSQNGNQYTITNAAWNGTVATGGTAQTGFQTTYSGAFSAPTNCTINGTPCSGSTPPTTTTTTTVPSTTTTTRVPPTTTTTTTTTAPPTTTTTTTVPGGGSSSPWWASFAKTDDWGTGYTANYTFGTTGPTVMAWTLTFKLPSNESVTGLWDGNLTQNGSIYTVTNAAWNGTVAAGTSVQIGFQGGYGGTFSPPTDCQVNGQACGSEPGTGSGGGGSGGSGGGGGGSGGGGSGGTPLPPLPGSTNLPFAPYIDTTLYPAPDMTADIAATGTKDYSLGFVVTQGSCIASWGGYYPVSSGYYAPEIQTIRAAGGDVIASFGGAAGVDLADSCTTAAALQSQYQSVINQYNITHVDFDIEGADGSNQASIALRFQALAGLETANPSLSVSLTLPVLPTGLVADGLNIVKAAIADGVRIDLVNVMTMDYGDGPAPSPAGKMGTYAIDAAQATHTQLQALYPALSPATVWSMVGVTPLLGVNDIADEIFGLSDAQQVATFAQQVHLGRLSMWAATRDVQCAGGVQTYSSETCSGVLQQPYAFAKIMNTFTG
jgi:hypothetical protein